MGVQTPTKLASNPLGLAATDTGNLDYIEAGRQASNKPSGPDQILFIDSRVKDKDSLLRGVASGTQVYILNADQDGLAQIAAVLASQKNAAAVSIIAHGNSGEMELGNGLVTQATLANSAASLKTIGQALAPGGDLLLYGCDVGAGTVGHSFVSAVSTATGAIVAAASHIVGDVAAGENWNLDVVSNAKPIAAAPVLSQAALNSYQSPLLASSQASLPITINNFTGDTSFDTTGSATISGSALQLTTATTNEIGLAVYNNYIPSSAGISVQFSYTSSGGSGADGISFFLLNADLINAAGGSASTVTAGGAGGGLGYSDDAKAGITDGFLGIGLDTYGNYSTNDGGQPGGATGVPNEVGVRGSGSGTTGYNLLTNAAFSPGIDGTHTVTINLSKINSTSESLTVTVTSTGSLGDTVNNTVISNYTINQALPNNFYFGFAASTGGSTDTHQINSLSVTACFLAGTHILTDRGEVPIEELLARHRARAPGEAADRVATLVDGEIAYQPIAWIGGRHVRAAEAQDTPPIRIRRSAFADNVPQRDLLLTAEHCVFLDGRLIPVRMLVNHRSIVEDRTIGGYSFFHIELAEHAILLAEGLSTESYLDTGNRATFGVGNVTTLRPALVTGAGGKSYADDACAPLAVDQATVQPVWTVLEQRAVALGFAQVRPPLALSDDPELRLLLCDGREMPAHSVNAGRHVFTIPSGTRPISLLSNAARPAEVIGPFVDDRRLLGVAVAWLVLGSGARNSVIEAEALSLPGWHALEDGVRWTNGRAALDLWSARSADRSLEVHVAAATRYPVPMRPVGSSSRAGSSFLSRSERVL